MKKTITILNELCVAIAEGINKPEVVDKALFLSLYPFYTKNLSISQIIERYYDEMFKQQWSTEIVQSKIRNRTLELITNIEGCISDSMKFVYLPKRRGIESLIEIETLNNLALARKTHKDNDFQRYFDFDSYRHLKAVSALEDMAEVSDFKTKQLLLIYKVLKIIEDLINIILKSLVRADIIFYVDPVVFWTPAQCLEVFNDIRTHCSKNYISCLFDDKTKILKDYCGKDKHTRAQLLLDNVYNALNLRHRRKQEVCAIVYLLYEKRVELGFRTDCLCKFSQFKKKIYEYYRLSPSTFKRNQIKEIADDFRNEECIVMIQSKF